MDGWTAKDMPDQGGCIALITGANSGLGYESAVALAHKGAQVIMACRNPDKADHARQDLLKRVPNAVVELMALDLGSLQSVRAFVDAFSAKYDRLDILMNNAGIMAVPYGKTADGFEMQFGTNHLGHFALTGLLLPKLLKTAHSRVVSVSSFAYLTGHMNFDDLQGAKKYSRWSAYSQSKLANLLFVQELQRKLAAAHADLISVAAHPGYALTNLQKNQNTPLLDRTFGLILTRYFTHPVDVAARSQLYAATMPDVRGGEFYGPKRMWVGNVGHVGLNARAKNVADAARLWQISEQLTGVQYAALNQAAPAYA